MSTVSARGFSPVTIENATGVLERFLELLGIPAWEAGPDDVDRVVGELIARGMAASTRRGYVQAFRDFHRFVVARKAAEIDATFGVALADPVDEFNAARHVGNDSPSTRPPPTPERMEEFFAFLRDRIATAPKFASAGRDYPLFRTLYHCGLRSDEAASLQRADLHFDRGPFGKIHVRFGKAARGSGPRPRWVPMLDQVDLILRWFLDDVRPRMADSPALFCDEGGGVLHRGTMRNRLRYLLELEGHPIEERFSPHGLRHACATRNYERGVDLVAIQQMLGLSRDELALGPPVRHHRARRIRTGAGSGQDPPGAHAHRPDPHPRCRRRRPPLARRAVEYEAKIHHHNAAHAA